MATTRRATRKSIQELLESSRSAEASPAQARRAALSAHGLAGEFGEPLLQGEALLNLGRYRLVMVHPDQTLPLLDRASKVFAANRRPDRVAACEALRARALLDMGRDMMAIRVAEAVIAQPAAGPADQVRADLVRALALGRLGRLDAASALCAERIVPGSRVAGEPHLIVHALCVHAISLIFDLFARRLPKVWHGGMPGLAQRTSASAPEVRQIEDLLGAAEAALPSGTRWRFIEGLRYFLTGLTGDRPSAEAAVSRLSSLALLQLEADPPQAAWLRVYRGYVEHRLDESKRAIVSFTQAATLGETLGLSCLVREAHNQLAHLYESVGDASGALRSQKQLAKLHMLSIFDPEALSDPAMGPLAASEVRSIAAEPLPYRDVPTRHHPVPHHVRLALRRIDDWGHGKLSVGDVVQASGVSRRTLELAMKACCDTTIAEAIRRQSMSRAAGQLRDTSASIAEVAAATGYSSTAAFGSAFRAQHGVSPSRWRREQSAR